MKDLGGPSLLPRGRSDPHPRRHTDQPMTLCVEYAHQVQNDEVQIHRVIDCCGLARSLVGQLCLKAMFPHCSLMLMLIAIQLLIHKWFKS